MAEFCSQCNPFTGEPAEFDLFKIAVNLKRGHSETILCEGCNIRGIYKDEAGLIYLAELAGTEIKLKEVGIDTLMGI